MSKTSFFFTNEGRKVGLIEKGILIAIMYLIYLQTNRRYKEKYLYFRKKWINEEKNKKRVNGFLVILFVLSPLFFIVLIASYFGKTNF